MNRNLLPFALLCGLSVLLIAGPALAATLCVNPGGTMGCYSTIGAAVAAASANDTINVAAGKYKEDVVIGKPLSLVGANRSTTAINANGLSNGIYIDGLDNPGLSGVVVTGFTVQNADFEGILVTNASDVTISNNQVLFNDKSLDPSGPSCPGQPAFETGEDFDCGEGVHLSGADHSIVANNVIQSNSGGILLSDDTAETHDNLISGNLVMNNALDCGITLASHTLYPNQPGTAHAGVDHNTIANNQSVHNGFQGEGAGVGLFSDGSGPGFVSGNVVINNQLRNNGIPGVAFHSHAPGDTFADNMIVGNQISGNGADSGDTATPGTTGINVNSGFGFSPITGTIVAQNMIKDEADQIVLNTPAQVNIHLNNFLDNTIGVDNLGAGTGDAIENWWNCAAGPGAAAACASVGGSGVLFAPWLTMPFQGGAQ
ncbi:MAG TPA: NosD domain-containing protein [Terriglobia bacterium]|nr:NosD domain-containing protein [Terriglobia bacterium]